MTRKDYRAAAEIVRKLPRHAPALRTAALTVENAFVELFNNDSYRFDEARFRAACKV